MNAFKRSSTCAVVPITGHSKVVGGGLKTSKLPASYLTHYLMSDIAFYKEMLDSTNLWLAHSQEVFDPVLRFTFVLLLDDFDPYRQVNKFSSIRNQIQSIVISEFRGNVH